MKGNDSPNNLQKSSRRRILSTSAGVLATGLAGCSELSVSNSSSSGSQLSVPDQTALQTYTNSYETSQEAKQECDAGVETFRNNLTTNDDGEQVIRGDYLSDWPDLYERMRNASRMFSDANAGFNQARRSASSSVIQTRCEEASEWVEAYNELCKRFIEIGETTKEIVAEQEQKISELSPPLTPEELRTEI